MFRQATRIRLPAARASFTSTPTPSQARTRTLFTTTTPTIGSRFRSAALRWGLAGGLVYYYNTSPIFADEPAEKRPHLSSRPPPVIEAEKLLPTLDEIRDEAKRKKADASKTMTQTERTLTEERSPESIEQEAEQQGAFNEETGEINWDCPCLGGMAHGPCGENFRTAFSCFVFSKEEPKGVDCIEKFKGMQECFAKFPEIYGVPQDDDEVEHEIDEKLDVMTRENQTEGGAAPKQGQSHPAPTDEGVGDVGGISISPPPGKDESGSSLGLGHPAPGEGVGGSAGNPSPAGLPGVSGGLR